MWGSGLVHCAEITGLTLSSRFCVQLPVVRELFVSAQFAKHPHSEARVSGDRVCRPHLLCTPCHQHFHRLSNSLLSTYIYTINSYIQPEVPLYRSPAMSSSDRPTKPINLLRYHRRKLKPHEFEKVPPLTRESRMYVFSSLHTTYGCVELILIPMPQVSPQPRRSPATEAPFPLSSFKMCSSVGRSLCW
jgi:hypothetical protein